MSTTPESYELFRLENIAYDVALNFGNVGDVALARMQRLVQRAMFLVAGHDRRWSWLEARDSIVTVSAQEEYSLSELVREVESFWIEESNRQKLSRIPTNYFQELVPMPTDASGAPRMYDFRGVDSSGNKVVSFYPIPDDAIEIFYRFSKQIVPVKNVQQDIRQAWGIPANIASVVIETATALAYQGVNDARYQNQLALCTAMIDAAYAADQSHPDTTYRARLQAGNTHADGPLLGPLYGE